MQHPPVILWQAYFMRPGFSILGAVRLFLPYALILNSKCGACLLTMHASRKNIQSSAMIIVWYCWNCTKLRFWSTFRQANAVNFMGQHAF